jgi:hypothetical protein
MEAQMSNMTKEQLEKEIQKTLAQANEILKKSGMNLNKAEGDEVDPGHAEPDADQMGGPSDQDADNAAPMEGQEGAPEGAPMEGAAPEGQEGAPAEGQEGGEGDEQAAMAEHAAQMSDEQLHMIIDICMAEAEKRSAAQGQGAEGAAPEGAAAPGAAPAPAAAPAPMEEAEKSMKKEFSSLVKSISDLKDVVKSLAGDMSSLKKSTSVKPTSKPAATRSIQVLQKSNGQSAKTERLSKSETLKFLENDRRKGNKEVNTDVIATINACQDSDDLHREQDRLQKEGIVKFPF